jgi:hypothetical protein
MLGARSFSSAERSDMSRYALFLIVLVALALAATAGNIIWGD